MKVTVKILQGRECTVDVLESSKVSELKDSVERLMSIPAQTQRLVFKGKTLADELSMKDSGITEAAKIHLMQKKPETASVTLGPSKAGSSSTMAPTQIDFFVQLDTFLRKHLTIEQTSLVVNEFRKNCQLMVDSMNFEDIERFAASNCTEF